jgi:hypothetical protein
MKRSTAAAVLFLAGTPALAHRLDEYLQGTILSIEKSRVQAQITLTPGVIVFPALIPQIDTDGNGAISDGEQRAYAARVLRDLTLTVDGQLLIPKLVSARFPAVEEMKEGRGEIQIEFAAGLPRGARNRKLTFENRHQSQIAAYQVNCLVPSDPDIRITAQNRNYSQSLYELDYEETDMSRAPFLSSLGSDGSWWLSAVAMLLLARFAFLWRRRGRHLSPAPRYASYL